MKILSIWLTPLVGSVMVLLTSCKDERAVHVDAECRYLEKLSIANITSDHVAAVLITCGRADMDGVGHQSAQVEVIVRNNGPDTLWYHGDNGHPFIKMEYWDEKSQNMIDADLGYSGTGAMNHPLRPDQVIRFKTFVRLDLIEQPHRVGVPITTSPTAFNYVWVLSPLFDLESGNTVTKHEQAGTGQPATAPESEAEGGKNPKPESEPAPW